MRFGDVKIEIADGTQLLRWGAVVSFSPAPIRYPILGLAGCLQYFDATFRGDGRMIEISPNSTFSGSIVP